MLSHGFLKEKINKEKIIYVRDLIFKFLRNESQVRNYYKNIEEQIPEANSLISSDILRRINNLIKNKNVELKVTELHVQLPKCEKIPPHQDNFYHCVDYDKSLKILIPLQEMDLNNGGLIYADIQYDYPILKHNPSSIPGFSSFISESEYFKKNFKETNYIYKLGDCSYHFGNSIHRSIGNKTNLETLFLVFRFEVKNSEININLQKQYNDCFKQHQDLISKKK